MFTKSTPYCAIDSVWCAEVEVKRTGSVAPPQFRALLVHSHSKSGATFGTCPVVHSDSSAMVNIASEATLKRLEEFLESLEADYAKTLFEAGSTKGMGAETSQGIKFGIGGSE